MKECLNKRIVFSPSTSSKSKSGEVLSVLLSDDEDVQWTFAYTESGEKYANGYNIIKKKKDL